MQQWGQAHHASPMIKPAINPKLAAGLLFAGAACCTFLPLTALLVVAGGGVLYLDASR